MKKRFTEEQIVDYPGTETGTKVMDVCRKHRNQRRNILQLESQVRRDDRKRCAGSCGCWRRKTSG